MAGSDGGTHGFLFADLRGYTGLVEGRGALAASQLLERYRTLTRQVVAEHGGAEIKTEGDSFYVVLPSASGAVRCGLALVAACAQPPDRGELIRVGVGIHAGEAIAHEGGYVGSAVNIAARVCSVAGPGQLLATATVRELTRSVVDARFVALGRKSLKGIADPVDLFRVQPTGSLAVPVTRLTRLRPVGSRTTAIAAPLGLLAAAAAIVLVLTVLTPGRPTGGANGSSRSATVLSSPSVVQSIAAAAGAFPSTDEVVLLDRLPPSITKNCSRSSNPAPVARVSIVCSDLPGLSGTELHLRWFPDTPVTAGARIKQLAADRALPAGECTDGAEAHTTWGIGSVPTGQVACFYPDSIFNAAYVYWSYDGDGILVEARLIAHRLANLETWWKSNAAGLIADARPPRPAPSS
ncbi:MAG: adenylate/guanylate cyclase domain-containing protein [Chloroflexota bacterium]